MDVIMRIAILILSLNLSNFLNAQELVVVKAKKAFLAEEKLKLGDTVTYEHTVFIKNNGKLELSGISSKNFFLKPGTHQIREEHLNHLELHKNHDSIYNEMKLIGIADCNFNYELYSEPIFGSVRTYELGHIEIERDSSISEYLGYSYFAEVNSNEVTELQIRWTNPDQEYDGNYFVLVEDISEDFRELISTDTTQINFDLTPYISESVPILIFNIIAEDCRDSRPAAVAIRTE